MAKTLQRRLCAALEARGLDRVPSRNKYIMYRRTGGGFYFVGKAGALRFTHGTSAAAANSIPVSDKFKDSLLNGSA